MKFAGARLLVLSAHGVRTQVGHEPGRPIHWYGLNPSISRADTKQSWSLGPEDPPDRRPQMMSGQTCRQGRRLPAGNPLTSVFGDLRHSGASVKLRHPSQTHVLVYTIPRARVPSSDSFIDTNVLN
jgi:hypothetical protein